MDTGDTDAYGIGDCAIDRMPSLQGEGSSLKIWAGVGPSALIFTQLSNTVQVSVRHQE